MRSATHGMREAEDRAVMEDIEAAEENYDEPEEVRARIPALAVPTTTPRHLPASWLSTAAACRPACALAPPISDTPLAFTTLNPLCNCGRHRHMAPTIDATVCARHPLLSSQPIA